MIKLFSIFFLAVAFGLISGAAEPIVQYVDRSDFKMVYYSFGKGKPLIIINGGPGRSSNNLNEVAKKLSIDRQVILFDQRGTGKSTLKVVDESSITFDLMIEDLERLRKHLKIEKLTLLGHSFGGMYAMAYAAKYPNNVDNLILSASGPIDLKLLQSEEATIEVRLDKESLKKYKFYKSKEQKKLDPVRAKIESLRLIAPLYVFDKKFIPIVEKNLIDLEHYSQQINQLVWKDMTNKKYDLKEALAKLKVPTLIIDGEQDFLGPEVPRQIHQSIPNSRLEILKECSHYPWLDKPIEYYALIESFLKATQAPNK